MRWINNLGFPCNEPIDSLADADSDFAARTHSSAACTMTQMDKGPKTMTGIRQRELSEFFQSTTAERGTVADRENRDLLPPSGYSGCWLPSLPISSGLLWGQTDHWLTNGRQYKLLANVAHASTACGAERSKRHAWPLLHDSGFGRVAPPVVHHILITWASMRLGRHRAHSCAQTVGDWAESLLYGAQLDTSLNVAMK